MSYSKEEIGAILRNLRLNAGLTQKEAALKIGRTQQIIGHWETGYSQPDADTLFTLCDLYGADISEAFGFNKKTNDTPSIAPIEFEMVLAYRAASADDKTVVDTVLRKYRIKNAPPPSDCETASELLDLSEQESVHLMKSSNKN